jgi:hypothetical protein
MMTNFFRKTGAVQNFGRRYISRRWSEEVGARLGEYVTSDKTVYNPCNKLPTQVSKRGPDEQNFIESKHFPVQQNLRKSFVQNQ